MEIDLKIIENEGFNDEYFDYVRYTVLVNGNACFISNKYIKKQTVGFDGYAATNWKVDPNKPANFYVQQIVKFYKGLKEGGFEERNTKMQGIYFTPAGVKKKPEMLSFDSSGNNMPALEDSLPLDIECIIFKSPFGNFGMHSGGDPYFSKPVENWSPEKGFIGVINHQDISILLAELLSSTAKDPIDCKHLSLILKMIYTFE